MREKDAPRRQPIGAQHGAGGPMGAMRGRHSAGGLAGIGGTLISTVEASGDKIRYSMNFMKINQIF